MMDATEQIDATFEAVTVEDGRFAERFSTDAGSGWLWGRFPAEAAAQHHIIQDW
jgi:hypothetical protein